VCVCVCVCVWLCRFAALKGSNTDGSPAASLPLSLQSVIVVATSQQHKRRWRPLRRPDLLVGLFMAAVVTLVRHAATHSHLCCTLQLRQYSGTTGGWFWHGWLTRLPSCFPCSLADLLPVLRSRGAAAGCHRHPACPPAAPDAACRPPNQPAWGCGAALAWAPARSRPTGALPCYGALGSAPHGHIPSSNRFFVHCRHRLNFRATCMSHVCSAQTLILPHFHVHATASTSRAM
jgi:hypothetical protein